MRLTSGTQLGPYEIIAPLGRRKRRVSRRCAAAVAVLAVAVIALAAGWWTTLKPFTVLEPVASLSNARLKPGSNDWLAYQSSESGRSEVYLTKFPRAGAKYQVSPAGGSQPVWGKDGKKLYYLDDSQRITAVDVQTANDSVQVGPPKTLFPTGVRTSISAEGYDVTRDGRFLVVNSVTQNTAPVILVMNWEAGLKK